MIQMALCCYNEGRLIWQGPMTDIPTLPGGRCALEPGEIFRLSSKVVIMANASENGIIQMVLMNDKGEIIERISEHAKYFELQNFHSLVAVRAEEKYLVYATDTGEKIGKYLWIEEHDNSCDKKIVAEGMDGQLQLFF